MEEEIVDAHFDCDLSSAERFRRNSLQTVPCHLSRAVGNLLIPIVNLSGGNRLWLTVYQTTNLVLEGVSFWKPILQLQRRTVIDDVFVKKESCKHPVRYSFIYSYSIKLNIRINFVLTTNFKFKVQGDFLFISANINTKPQTSLKQLPPVTRDCMTSSVKRKMAATDISRRALFFISQIITDRPQQ